MGTRSQMLALERALAARLPGRLYVHVLRSPKYRGFMCEIAPAGVTKWSGVLRYAESRGIVPAEICAVGDDVNDVPMIEASGLGVAMGNAPPEVQAAADRVAPPLEADGLAQVVAWLLE
jgi:hydroxymethylpyrimidine pyrophosphatase-like HAD family hydrolase